MKLTYTRVLSRNIFLAFLLFVIILVVAALVVRNSITHKFRNLSNVAHNIGDNESKPEHALLLVHQAEDDFQASLLKADTQRSGDYKRKLFEAFKEIESFLKEKPDTTGLTAAGHNNVRALYRQKLKLSDKLYSLKLNFDSLLTAYAGFSNAVFQNPSAHNRGIHLTKQSSLTRSDTLKKQIVREKKGLIARLRDAIANKNNPTGTITEINKNQTNKIIDSTDQKIMARDAGLYSRQLKYLQQRNLSLLATQRTLISVNMHISTELENIINDEKEINYKLQSEFNSIAFKSYRDTTRMLNSFYLAALFLVLLFAILLIIFVLKLDKSEALLREENQHVVEIAQQKMDLLLHMSHEIRNPLTSIRGFLYIFSKTPLTPRQSEMLGSIRLSSDMLLQTLNDTLDAAKMESSEFKINAEPFNPDFVLRAVIESMNFSASKKNLTFEYHFEGDNDLILSGDSFRLKQVMVNLLSNAIKYTHTGGITIKAMLEFRNGLNYLHIDVADTGEGISTEQQTRLFSKYYQTSSAKGKTGTGLGLYICKELIKLQKGNIMVKSEAGKGTTFSFNIPYQPLKQSENDINQQFTDDPVALLNSIKILAVDDNELNLSFLKMMLNKWNITFYKATNGKEALELLSKESINIVLTDIHMPEMNGNELLTAIKLQKNPIKNIPVIVMSGDPADRDALLKKGFAGVITKPFVEAELVKEISKAIKG